MMKSNKKVYFNLLKKTVYFSKKKKIERFQQSIHQNSNCATVFLRGKSHQSLTLHTIYFISARMHASTVSTNIICRNTNKCVCDEKKAVSKECKSRCIVFSSLAWLEISDFPAELFTWDAVLISIRKTSRTNAFLFRTNALVRFAFVTCIHSNQSFDESLHYDLIKSL
jgi:hypothetical protein